MPDAVEILARQICAERGLRFEGLGGVGAFKRTFSVHGPLGHCALKLIVGAIDPQRVSREIAALRACNHRAICHLHDVGTFPTATGTVVYLLEEFIAGGDLSARIATRPLTRDEGVNCGIRLSEAVAHLEERRIVHRDIKPDNVLLRDDGTPVLVDLGVARNLADASLTQTWLAQGPGTPAYAPPEQLRNEKAMIDWRADQFSLGVTLSIAILGMHPYSGSLALDGVVERVGERHPPVAEFVQAAEAIGLGLLVRMVAPWPIQRYSRPAQLIEAWQSARNVQ